MREIRLPLAAEFRDGANTYQVFVLGTGRDDGTWEAHLSFEPAGKGKPLLTAVETTQPNERAMVHWAQGLGPAFFEGAFQRASRERIKKPRPTAGQAIRGTLGVRLAEVEEFVLRCFTTAKSETLKLKSIFDRSDEYSNADIVRVVDQLVRSRRAERFTEQGEVWVSLNRDREKSPGKKSLGTDRPRHIWRGVSDPEVLYVHPHPLLEPNGRKYEAAIAGVERTDGTWSAWVEFRDLKTNRLLRTGQETSQPNRDSLAYWASGIEDIYFEGALERAKAVKTSPPRSRKPAKS